ncbi:MAG: pyrimidine/purine nucleoside phosphorylase, partial [Gammaproteobacteria bacterium]|nr:pyrimidine/purine nucleoside phosphorylase [Gammaproteobacteria bacterium]
MSGDTEVLLPGSDDWVVVKGGESFEVAADATFSIKALTPTDYCCSFEK